MLPFTKLTGLFAATALVATALPERGTNYESALRQARQQGKAVLADFTGSDWCWYCIRLRKEVLAQADFAAWAAEHFVLLEVDVPQNPNFDAQLLEQNRALCSKYRIDGFPTVLVLDEKGRAVGGVFGFVSKPSVLRRALEPGLQAAALLRKAEQVQGEDKLQTLLAAWRLIPEPLYELNAELQAELAAIDVQDLSGLRGKAEAQRVLRECAEAADAAPTDAAALVIIEQALAGAVPENRRELLELKYRLLMRGLETPEDVRQAAEVAFAMIDADRRLSSEQKENYKRQLRGVFANPQTSINRSKMRKRRRPKR